MPTNMLSMLLLPLFAALLIAVPRAGAEATLAPYEGFGATTPGGPAEPKVHVTTLNDSGPGSLREALAQGNRTVVFDVAGDIRLRSAIRVTGAFITIDGGSAPGPVTLKGAGLSLQGTKGAHDVIVRGLRIRDAAASPSADGITIASGAHHIVVDHVSICCSTDGNLDITFDSHDVTVSWSILAGNTKNMLIKYNPARVTLHHNLFAGSATRNPQVSAVTPATDTTVDMRNNVIWDWGKGYGTLVWENARANIVKNYYWSPRAALRVEDSRVYAEGNLSPGTENLNLKGTEPAPFPAAPVATQEACEAAHRVLTDAGARPLDSIDQLLLPRITLSVCP